MKGLVFILAIIFSFTAFAEESQTECPMMKDQTIRNNPKANMVSNKIKESKKSKVSAQ